jgi:hypothetical protein
LRASRSNFDPRVRPLKRPGGGRSNLWSLSALDRWSWFIPAKLELNTKSPHRPSGDRTCRGFLKRKIRDRTAPMVRFIFWAISGGFIPEPSSFRSISSSVSVQGRPFGRGPVTSPSPSARSQPCGGGPGGCSSSLNIERRFLRGRESRRSGSGGSWGRGSVMGSLPGLSWTFARCLIARPI